MWGFIFSTQDSAAIKNSSTRNSDKDPCRFNWFSDRGRSRLCWCFFRWFNGDVTSRSTNDLITDGTVSRWHDDRSFPCDNTTITVATLPFLFVHPSCLRSPAALRMTFKGHSSLKKGLMSWLRLAKVRRLFKSKEIIPKDCKFYLIGNEINR